MLLGHGISSRCESVVEAPHTGLYERRWCLLAAARVVSQRLAMKAMYMQSWDGVKYRHGRKINVSAMK